MTEIKEFQNFEQSPFVRKRNVFWLHHAIKFWLKTFGRNPVDMAFFYLFRFMKLNVVLMHILHLKSMNLFFMLMLLHACILTLSLSLTLPSILLFSFSLSHSPLSLNPPYLPYFLFLHLPLWVHLFLCSPSPTSHYSFFTSLFLVTCSLIPLSSFHFLIPPFIFLLTHCLSPSYRVLEVPLII